MTYMNSTPNEDCGSAPDVASKRRAGMGSHELPNEGKTNVWLTPQWIITALGPFELDPCAAPEPRPYPTANHHYALTDRDGLRAEWFGRVWLNPPYGPHVEAWMERMVQHDCGIALIFARTETSTWQRCVWPHASAILFPDKRITFVRPDGTPAGGNSGAPSAFIAYGHECARRLMSSGISGAMVSGALMLRGAA